MFESVILFGKVEIIKDTAQKIPVLEALVGKYSAESMESGKEHIRKGCGSCAYQLTIEHITGKRGVI